MRHAFWACFWATVLAGSIPAVTIGQRDTFQNGTTMGWFVPGPSGNPPSNVASGGPGGVGDSYLRLEATGIPGPGGRLSVLNTAQWAGDYITARVLTISMDVNNFGPDDVYVRLLFEDFAGGGPPVNLALTDAVLLSAGSGWRKAVFSIQPSVLTALIGTAAGALASVDTLRIFHNPDPDFPGPGAGIPPVAAVLGVDNIAAIPEPSTVALLAGGLAALLIRRLPRP